MREEQGPGPRPPRHSESNMLFQMFQFFHYDIPPACSLLLPSTQYLPSTKADLYEWTKPLDAMDAALSYIMESNPKCLLIMATSTRRHRSSAEKAAGGEGGLNGKDEAPTPSPVQAESAADVASVPLSAFISLRTILRFQSGLLRNCYNKLVYNSVPELSDLLACADEEVAGLALEALANLSVPPQLHRQQQPELVAHTTALHSAPAPTSGGGVHGRLVSLSKGWGTRGSNLGLYACVTADDSPSGGAALPHIPGEILYEYYRESEAGVGQSESLATSSSPPPSGLVTLRVPTEDILTPTTSATSPSRQVEKRRRTEASPIRPAAHSSSTGVRSTAELFFHCLSQVGGRSGFPQELVFPLLADVRLARAFHTRADRIAAVRRRLLALVAILQAHPLPEFLSSYFNSQTELCAELCDLVRPTVSAATVSAATAGGSGEADGDCALPLFPSRRDAISTLSDDSGPVPYTVRTLAVEALTALVARRDGSSGGLSGIARHANALGELGVAKGQFFGLLPTLIRFTLSSLNAFLSKGPLANRTGDGDVRGIKFSDVGGVQPMETDEIDDSALGLSLGLVFCEATMPPQLPRQEQEERVLEFIDVVLTLTSAVVSIPAGTSALTDCGLIPALVSTTARDSDTVNTGGHGDTKASSSNLAPENNRRDTDGYVGSLLRFVSGQAVQILEAAIVTHSSALIAFQELKGVDLLVKRLCLEINEVKRSEADQSDNDNKIMHGSKEAVVARELTGSRRVLLFSLTNCLTVVFHQQENSTSASVTSTGATQLRKPEVTASIIEVIRHINIYGGTLGSLFCTLLSDVMNSDPQIVHYIHSSGIATAFFDMIKINKDGELNIPASPELVMTLANVISALSLTEQGAKDTEKANPFPALLRMFYSSKYVMPMSRCLLNEMGAIVGTGLDEIMRHVPSLSTTVNKAIVDALQRLVVQGKGIVEKEMSMEPNDDDDELAAEVEASRTCLLQYTYNFSQLLEQVLHHESHSSSFVDFGGLDALLDLFPLLIPRGSKFIAHISCLSGPSFAKLSHLTNSAALTVAIRSIAANTDAQKMINKLVKCMEIQFEAIASSKIKLRDRMPNIKRVDESEQTFLSDILDGIPRVPMHTLEDSPENAEMTSALSGYLRELVVMEWLSNLLTSTIRVASQKSSEVGTVWGRIEKEWKKELASKSFEDAVDRLATLHRECIEEVCRLRTENGYQQREEDRCRAPSASDAPENKYHPKIYRLRIVCAEGAVLRDGIDIDSCTTVGGLEIGEIVEATERCVNASGVLRYRTRCGWLSEQTRGHSREPIVEVLGICGVNNGEKFAESTRPPGPVGVKKRKRTECGISDLSSATAGIMARIQHSRKNLFSCLSRTAVLGARGLQPQYGPLSFQQGTVGNHVSSLIRSLSRNLRGDFAIDSAREAMKKLNASPDRAGRESALLRFITMYFGSMLSLLHSSIHEERSTRLRERDFFNLFLLFSICYEEGLVTGMKEGKGEVIEENTALPSSGFLGALRFVLAEGLDDVNALADRVGTTAYTSSANQVLTRYTAASLPPAIALLRRLVSLSPLTDSTSTACVALKKMKPADLDKLFGARGRIESIDRRFHMGLFCRSLYSTISGIAVELWKNPRLASVPAHILHPVLNLYGESMRALQLSTKIGDDNRTGSRTPRAPGGLHPLLGGLLAGEFGSQERSLLRARIPPRSSLPFEPSEDVICRLAEMGFNRDHALEALETTESNRLEIAMEYCLSHPHPSPATVERRRAAREAAATRRRQQSIASNTEFAVSNATETDQTEIVAAPRGDSNTDENADKEETETQIDLGGSKKEQEMTEKEKKERDQKALNEASRTFAKEKLVLMQKHIISGAIDVIEGIRSHDKYDANCINLNCTSIEPESIPITVCSFLLEFCMDSPSERSVLVSSFVKRLISHIVVIDGRRTTHRVAEGKDTEFASLMHATVICLRGLPMTRSIVLKHGLVGKLLSCLRGTVSVHKHDMPKEREASKSTAFPSWPRWAAPSLLLLDVMAQPTADTLDVEVSEKYVEIETSKEFHRACAEQKRQSRTLSKATRQIFSLINQRPSGIDSQDGDSKNTATEDAKGKKVQGKDAELKMGSDRKHTAETSSSITEFPSIPSYVPLIMPDAAEACMHLCLQILRRYSHSKSISKGKHETEVGPSQGVLHAAMLLLSRVLRSQQIAMQCLKLSGAEILCSLPKQCRFEAKTGITTMILRRMLEDSTTLQTIMETEIRALVTRLSKQPRGSGRSRANVNISLESFLQGTTSLICRDPLVFLKAAAVSVRIDVKPAGGNSQTEVVLLSAEEGAKHSKLLADNFCLSTVDRDRSSSQTANTSVGPTAKRGRTAKKEKTVSSSKVSKGKSPHTHRSSCSRRSLSPKKERKQITLNGTPSNHITTYLLREMIESFKKSSSSPTSTTKDFPHGFLSTVDYLEILSDLVLAVPACAAAIHRFRISGVKVAGRTHSINHALVGCPLPPNTAVNFLLHELLPQPRYPLPSLPADSEADIVEGPLDVEVVKEKRQRGYEAIKSSQTAARLIVALVARAGEGRKRVIADLAFALNGGAPESALLPPKTNKTSNLKSARDEGRTMSALQAWGELCIGLAAPRSSGASQDTNATLSFEVVRLMLENGMAHAVMCAIGRIQLDHPLAPGTATALLRPLEVFLRGSVTDTVQKLIEADKAKNTGRSNKNVALVSPAVGTLHRGETVYEDDAMLEDGFDADTAARNREMSDGEDYSSVEDEAVGPHDEAGVDPNDLWEEDNESSSHDDDSDDEMDDDSEEMSSDESEDSDDEEGSNSESSEVSDEEVDDAMSEDEGVINGIGHQDLGGHFIGAGGEEAFDYDDIAQLAVEDDTFFTAHHIAGAGDLHFGEAERDEGWTFLAGAGDGPTGAIREVNHGTGGESGIGLGAGTDRSGGMGLEAMLGQILRAGDIPTEAMAELEETLGIRISNPTEEGRGGGNFRAQDNVVRNDAFGRYPNVEMRNADRGPVGAVPSVRQGTPPDIGYASINPTGRFENFNAMEYVYGGPLVASGSCYYNLSTPLPSQEDFDDSSSSRIPANVSTQLFPGGTLVSTHVRRPHQSHPLLRDIELGPINSLVSSGRRGLLERQPRPSRSGLSSGSRLISSMLLSDPTGNNSIQNRGQDSRRFGGTTGIGRGMFEWTEDDRASDTGIGNFRAEFERVLREVVAEPVINAGTRPFAVMREREASPEPALTTGNSSNGNSAESERGGWAREFIEANNEEVEGSEGGLQNNEASADQAERSTRADEGPTETEGDGEESVSEGDNVATSLASGLRLSSSRESGNGSSDPAPGFESASANAPTEAISGGADNHRLQNEIDVSAQPDHGSHDHQSGESSGYEPLPDSEDRSQSTEVVTESGGTDGNAAGNSPNAFGLLCPPGMDLEVFNSLPLEMQQEVVSQHRATESVAAELDAASGLDPEALAALPEDMRREVIQQEQQERRLREEAPADPANAEEMDNASFIASLSPDLREEVLLTADDTFLSSLPPNIIAEANVLRERRAAQYRREQQPSAALPNPVPVVSANAHASSASASTSGALVPASSNSSSSRRRQRVGRMKVDLDRESLIVMPRQTHFPPLLTPSSMESLASIMFLLSPGRLTHRLLQKVFQNFCSNAEIRGVILTTFVSLLNANNAKAREAINALGMERGDFEGVSSVDFPPKGLIGTSPIADADESCSSSLALLRQRNGGNAAAAACHLPMSSRISSEDGLPPVVARRLIDSLVFLSKQVSSFSVGVMKADDSKEGSTSCLEQLLDLLGKPLYLNSPATLELLLSMLEVAISPLSLLPRDGDEIPKLSQGEIASALSMKKEWINVPTPTVSPNRLKLLCSFIKLEYVKDTSFVRVNTIARRLCRIEENRHYILRELTGVAGALAASAVNDLKALSIRLRDAVTTYTKSKSLADNQNETVAYRPSSQVSLVSSSSEMKLLRVLQALTALCNEANTDTKKISGLPLASQELVSLMESIDLDPLWSELTACLRLVSILEGVELQESNHGAKEEINGDVEAEAQDETGTGNSTVIGGKKLQNSVAGLLTRFLPSIEAFFVVNGVAMKKMKMEDEGVDIVDSGKPSEEETILGGKGLLEFVKANKILLNALIRSNPSLMDKGLRAMATVPGCRPHLEFDVKRQWFKSQVRRLRQHASRRHGSVRLHIRRKHVFEDAFHQLQIRNGDELRGRLHVTFRNEEGVDAGGLSREFFAILAKVRLRLLS